MVGEMLVSEPVEGVTLAELAERLTAAVDTFDPGARVRNGHVLSGWPDTRRFLTADPEYDRLRSVDGIARACYVFHDSTMGSETAAYFERRDGDLEHVELIHREWYGEAVEYVRDTYGMDLEEDLLG